MSKSTRICIFGGCVRTHEAYGYCQGHWRQIRVHGAGSLKPLRGTSLTLGFSVEERFAHYVDREAECWIWTGSKTRAGYGCFSVDGRIIYAHRYAYERKNGEVPNDVQIDHRCHNRACVNPDHLQPVTNKLNQENRSGANLGNSTRVRGVSWREDKGKYLVRAMHDGVTYNGGSFDSLPEAEMAAISLRIELHSNNLIDRRV